MTMFQYIYITNTIYCDWAHLLSTYFVNHPNASPALCVDCWHVLFTLCQRFIKYALQIANAFAAVFLETKLSIETRCGRSCHARHLVCWIQRWALHRCENAPIASGVCPCLRRLWTSLRWTSTLIMLQVMFTGNSVKHLHTSAPMFNIRYTPRQFIKRQL